jgi:hypothetical protein
VTGGAAGEGPDLAGLVSGGLGRPEERDGSGGQGLAVESSVLAGS